MEKYIPYNKLSKKKQRELNKAKRGSWDGINPVTRMPENSKAYNRRKAQNWKRECCSDSVPFHFLQHRGESPPQSFPYPIPVLLK